MKIFALLAIVLSANFVQAEAQEDRHLPLIAWARSAADVAAVMKVIREEVASGKIKPKNGEDRSIALLGEGYKVTDIQIIGPVPEREGEVATVRVYLTKPGVRSEESVHFYADSQSKLSALGRIIRQ